MRSWRRWCGGCGRRCRRMGRSRIRRRRRCCVFFSVSGAGEMRMRRLRFTRRCRMSVGVVGRILRRCGGPRRRWFSRSGRDTGSRIRRVCGRCWMGKCPPCRNVHVRFYGMDLLKRLRPWIGLLGSCWNSRRRRFSRRLKGIIHFEAWRCVLGWRVWMIPPSVWSCSRDGWVSLKPS